MMVKSMRGNINFLRPRDMGSGGHERTKAPFVDSLVKSPGCLERTAIPSQNEPAVATCISRPLSDVTKLAMQDIAK